MLFSCQCVTARQSGQCCPYNKFQSLPLSLSQSPARLELGLRGWSWLGPGFRGRPRTLPGLVTVWLDLLDVLLESNFVTFPRFSCLFGGVLSHQPCGLCGRSKRVPTKEKREEGKKEEKTPLATE